MLAVLGMAYLTASDWSCYRFSSMTAGATPEILSTATACGVPDGAWIWLGCMKAVYKTRERRARLLETWANIQQAWGTDAAFEGILALRAALPCLEPAIQKAFDHAWRVEWHERWTAATHNKPAARQKFIDDWARCCQASPLPDPPTPTEVLKDVATHPTFWLDDPSARRTLSAFAAQWRCPGKPGRVLPAAYTTGELILLLLRAEEDHTAPPDPLLTAWCHEKHPNGPLTRRLERSAARHAAHALDGTLSPKPASHRTLRARL